MGVDEHAVKAAQKAYRECEGDSTESHRAALTAALPFLPVQGAVKKLEWRKYRNGDAEAVTPFGEIYTAYLNGYWRITRNGKAGKFIKATGGDDVEAAKAGAQADFDANLLALVRSQAVELLAAERAKTEMALEQRNMAIAELARLEADNAAQAARIKELEEAIDHSEGDYWRFLHNQCLELGRVHTALEAKLAAAEKALEFYADSSKWDDGYFKSEDDGTVLRAYPSSVDKDQGDKARAVLGGKPT